MSEEKKVVLNDDHLFTRKEAAKYLRMSLRTLDNLLSNEEITFIQKNRGSAHPIFIRKKHIDEYLDRHTHKANTNS